MRTKGSFRNYRGRPLDAAMDNVEAWNLGEACAAAAKASAGDYIDRGLALARELDAAGFAIVMKDEMVESHL